MSVLLSADRRLFRIAGWLALTTGILASVLYDVAYVGLFASADPRTVATQWVHTHAPPGSAIAFEQLPNGLINLPYFVTSDGFRPCIARFRAGSLRGPALFVMTDSYGLEEHPRIDASLVQDYQYALDHDPAYLPVLRIHYVPTFLGIAFPIDGAPHDWRYMDHDIKIYRHLLVEPGASRNFCYPDLASAISALYVSSASG
jgi:hypothetical protein